MILPHQPPAAGSSQGLAQANLLPLTALGVIGLGLFNGLIRDLLMQ